jgi:acetylornithine/succinyldiaminopimelate/putrescine aminotransferase
MAAVGCYVIERMQREFMVDRSMELGMLLESCLKDIKQRHHCGKGLLAGIEFDGPLMASLVVNACRRRGLLVVDTGRKWVKLGPQLTITSDEILIGCDILRAAIEEVENDIEAQRDTSEEPDKVDTGVQEPGVRDLPEDGEPTSAEDEGPKG